MLRSMTGYGSGNVETDDFSLSLELKSVNHRFMKLSGRVSEEFPFLQIEVEEIIRKRLVRGSVYYSVSVEPTRTEDLYDINLAVAEKYLKTLSASSGVPGLATEQPQLRDVLPLPGVVCSHDNLRLRKNGVDARGIQKEALLKATREATKQAVSNLVEMREREGQFLTKEFERYCEVLQELLESISTHAPQAVKEYNVRLLERVKLLLAENDVKVAPEDLLREVAIIAERSDVTEELVRMRSHLEQFRRTLQQPEPVGRKLEFIVQEMFRESNTMGAKVSSAELTRLIVNAKAEVDRLKEQVLNIE